MKYSRTDVIVAEGDCGLCQWPDLGCGGYCVIGSCGRHETGLNDPSGADFAIYRGYCKRDGQSGAEKKVMERHS